MLFWLARLRLGQKLSLIGLLALLMTAVPTVMFWTASGEQIAFTYAQERGEEAAVEMLQVVRLLQLHRGLSAGVLSGDDSMDAARAQRASEAEQRFAAVAKVIEQKISEPRVAQRWQQAGAEFTRLVAAVSGREIDGPASFARHSQLIVELGRVLDLALEYSGLARDPEPESSFLIAAALRDLPALTEWLGQARARGSRLLAAQDDLPIDRTRVEALLQRVGEQRAMLAINLDKAFELDSELRGRLAADVAAALKQVDEALQLGRSAVLDSVPPSHDAQDFFKQYTAVIDAQFALNQTLLSAVFNALEERIGRLQSERWSLLGLIAVLAALGVGLGGLIMRSLMRQLGGEPAYAAEVVQRITRGELEQAIQVSHGGASLLGDMRAMQQMLQRFMAAQVEMAGQHERGAIDHRIDAGQFPGAFERMAVAVNDLVQQHLAINRQVIDLAGRYAVGDLAADMARLPGQLANTSATMDSIKHNLSAISGELQRLVAAAAEGDFAARGDVTRFQFAFRSMIEGLNQLMHTAEQGLGDVGDVLEALAAGDLSRRVERRYRGAFGTLARDANGTAEQLGKIIGGIKQAAEVIRTAAAEISSGNADLSARTETQAASLEETASSMEQLTSTVQQNAENSRQARQQAVGASEVAVRGGAVVGDVVATMNEISSSSRRIEDIIGTIDGIAFQTNILALNAAVEAARAGEQGRGFAVVASEVRSLAGRSADAAKEIKQLIAGSTATVDKGSRLVAQAGETMQEVVAAVRRVTDLIGEIAAASDEQSSGIQQVNTTITQMDQVTQQNAALVEEASAAARALEEQANGLNQAVARFRL